MKVAPPTIAIAFGRSSGANITGTTASASGRITAAARPRTARAAISSPVLMRVGAGQRGHAEDGEGACQQFLAASPVAEQTGRQQRRR